MEAGDPIDLVNGGRGHSIVEALSSGRFVQPVNVAAVVDLLEEIYIDELGGLGVFGFWVSYCQHRSQLCA